MARAKKMKLVALFLVCALGLGYIAGGHLVALAHAGTLEKSASYLVYPVLWMQRVLVAPIKNYFKTRKTVMELTQELAVVTKERNQALKENVALHGICSFQSDIAEVAAFKKRYAPDHGVIGQVIAKQFSDHGHYFLVDAGQAKGIVKDMVALSDNAIVGRVQEVYPWYCKVVLVSDKSCKIAATTARTKAHGIYEGTNNTTLGKLSHVSHLSKMDQNDLLLSSGEGLVFPRGFGIGKITACTVNGLFYSVDVEPLVNLKDLNYCLLVKRESQR